ncbi:hypothetical protein ABVB69_37245 [Streptomyces sp. NPDC000349]|uniref:hypothetical protein n=1 Tax=Streptomyces sp. NPDC000349 TaxID=3154249 RepID=UPI003369E708
MNSELAGPVQDQPTADSTPTELAPAASPEQTEPTDAGASASPTDVHVPEPPVDSEPAGPVQDQPTDLVPADTPEHVGVAHQESAGTHTPAEGELAAAASINRLLAAESARLDALDSPAATTPIPAQTPVENPPRRLRSEDLAAADLPVYGQEAPGGREPSEGAVTLRRSAGPAFPATSGFSERRMLDALPPQLAEKVQGLPVAYVELARSYRQAQATRTGTKPAKRNIRLHADIAMAVNRQMVSDKRMLGLRNLKPSQYLDASITLARHVSVTDLIKAADEFRDSHLGEESGAASPNHYSISQKNDDWLNDMMDELLLANTTGLHGHMVNVIVQSFLEQLRAEAPATD